MKDHAEIKFVLMLLGVAAGTVSFTYGTFTTKEYVKEAIIERLDRIESKLDRLMEKQKQVAFPKTKKDRQDNCECCFIDCD